jgi:hypothetical protein
MISILRSALAASSLMLVLVSSTQAAFLGALMKSAINASDGRALGVLDDPVAGLIAKTTGSATQVSARIETVRVFRQAGCRRLKATLRQPVSGQPEAVFMFEMNLCRDGTVPQDGIDLEQVAGRFGVLQSVR